MTDTVKDVLEFVKENDVKFIRLAFCDAFGTQKNISVLSEMLESAFENGISFDASAIEGFSGETDLLLFPDAGTLTVLPWRPQQGRVARLYCNIKNLDKTEYLGDTRSILSSTVSRLQKLGYSCKIGTECEFYLFKTDLDGEPCKVPLDNGSYLDVSPLDKCENIRREICLTLEEMGIMPEISHHEKGPGQNEIDFTFSDPLSCADNLLTFKTVVKAVATRNGLFSSFMPKPFLNKNGNGLHINISLNKGGKNIFSKIEDGSEASYFIAGILEKIPQMSLFLNPITNSYERLGEFEVPEYVSWSFENRSQLLRIPVATEDNARIEIRSPDPAVNPYLAFSLIINAGLDGIENKLKLMPAVDKNLLQEPKENLKNFIPLPKNLKEAIKIAQDSQFIKDNITPKLLEKFLTFKKDENDKFSKALDKEEFYETTYFKTI